MLYFTNRSEAGRLLAARLHAWKNKPAIVLAIPRGGLPVAAEVARALQLPLDVVLTKKIGHPMNKEYAIGAAGLTDYFVVPHEEVTDAYIQQELEAVREKLMHLHYLFRQGKPDPDLRGKTVIVVDDGVATGNTLLATIRLLRKSRPEKIIVAVPVASVRAAALLQEEADEVVALFTPEEFYAIGAFYEDFAQLTDEEAAAVLEEYAMASGSRETK